MVSPGAYGVCGVPRCLLHLWCPQVPLVCVVSPGSITTVSSKFRSSGRCLPIECVVATPCRHAYHLFSMIFFSHKLHVSLHSIHLSHAVTQPSNALGEEVEYYKGHAS